MTRKSTKSPALRAKLKLVDGQLASLRKEFAAVKEAADKLAREPGDAEASLAVGKFQCFHKGDWDRGLHLLATGSDTLLVSLARQDLRSSGSVADQMAAGNGWLDLAEKEPAGATRTNLRRHGRALLYQALPRLTALDAAKVSDRLKRVAGTKTLKPGLVAEYFADEETTKKVKARLEYQAAENWGFGSPGPEVPADHFSARWQGYLIPPRKGRYTLFLHVDDGAQLYLDGKPIIDFWTKVGRHAVEVPLTEKPYHLIIKFREGTGAAMMVFGYVDGGTDKHVPVEWLFHDERQEKFLGK